MNTERRKGNAVGFFRKRAREEREEERAREEKGGGGECGGMEGSGKGTVGLGLGFWSWREPLLGFAIVAVVEATGEEGASEHLPTTKLTQ